MGWCGGQGLASFLSMTSPPPPPPPPGPEPAQPWWHEHNDSLRQSLLCESEQLGPERSEGGPASVEGEEVDPTFADGLLSAPLLALLDEVEAAFEETGADTPGWEDPHLEADGTSGDPSGEEYSRCLDPGKYRILWARAEAWMEVLTARGWADAVEAEGRDIEDSRVSASGISASSIRVGDIEDSGLAGGAQIHWAVPPRVERYRTTVLNPRRPGALPLVLARTAPDEAAGSTDLVGREALILGLVIGIGNPAVPVSTVPDCGCDACDSGSRDLLEDLDSTLLSVVDGSFEAVLRPGWTSQRTSFGAEGGGEGDSEGDSEEGSRLTMTLTAQPWAEGWTPRPLGPAITPHDVAPWPR